MNGKKAKAERRKVKQILDEKIETARRLKIDSLVGPPPTVAQFKRALRSRRRVHAR